MKRPVESLWIPLLQILVIFSCTWLMTQGKSQDVRDPNISCNDTKGLDQCWNNLSPIEDHGIPSTIQAVESACRVFDSGMECVDNWSKTCLSKQKYEEIMSSVSGALEIYRFLCTDKKFQRDFLKHGDCYKKVSHHWDECARKFIESLKRIDHNKDTLGLCCVRFRYLHCVTDVATALCKKNAVPFLQKLAESLVRTRARSYHLSQCINVGHRNCSVPNSAQSSTKFTSNSPSLSFIHHILAYHTKGLANFLNVLQNFAFTDISTFLCALSREFSPYFTCHFPKTDEDDGSEYDFLLNECEATTVTSTVFKSNRESLDFHPHDTKEPTPVQDDIHICKVSSRRLNGQSYAHHYNGLMEFIRGENPIQAKVYQDLICSTKEEMWRIQKMVSITTYNSKCARTEFHQRTCHVADCSSTVQTN